MGYSKKTMGGPLRGRRSALFFWQYTSAGKLDLRGEQVRDYITTDVPIGCYLADQIMLPLGISVWQAGNSQRVCSFRTLPLTRHSTTHVEILRQFLDIDIRVERADEGRTCKVSIQSRTASRNEEANVP